MINQTKNEGERKICKEDPNEARQLHVRNLKGNHS